MINKGYIASIGNTPLIYMKALSEITGCEIYGKAEFMNPGGSVKDRAALGMIEDAEKKGLIQKGGLIIEATSGNTGIGLAPIANIKGYKLKIYMPSNQAQEKVDTMRGLGAEVVLIEPAPYPDPKNYRMVAAKDAEASGAYYVNQFENLANCQAHYQTTGPELWEQTDHGISGFICAVGTGGTLAGVSQYLKEKNANIQIGCVDPAGSAMNQFFRTGTAVVSPGETISEGIGQSFATANVKQCRVDFSYEVTDQAIVDMVFYTIKTEGLFLATSSGANLCGAYLMAKRLGPGHKIVTLLCDNGQKYVSKLYNETFLNEKKLKSTGLASDLFPALNTLLK